MPIEAKLALVRTREGEAASGGGAPTAAGTHVEGADCPPPLEVAVTTLPLLERAIGPAGCCDDVVVVIVVEGSVRSSSAATCAAGAVTVAAVPPAAFVAIRSTVARAGDDVAPVSVDVAEETTPAEGPPSTTRITPAVVAAASTPVTVLAVVAAAPTVPVAFDETPDTTFEPVPVTPPTVCVTVPVAPPAVFVAVPAVEATDWVAAAGADAAFATVFVTGAGALTAGAFAAGVETFGAVGADTFGAAGVETFGAAGAAG